MAARFLTSSTDGPVPRRCVLAPGRVDRIKALFKDIRRDPYKGLGKPEPLRGALAGYWSRRVNDEQRMVYQVSGGDLLIAQLRYHY
jgi:toxin YoeB